MKYVIWRILAVQLLTNKILTFKNIGYMRMASKANYKQGLRELLGTVKRLCKIKMNNGK